MAGAIIKMRQGDTAPLPVITLLLADGTPLNMTGKTAAFNVRKGSTLLIDHVEMVVDDAAAGEVHFDGWDTLSSEVFNAMKGDYQCEVEVTLENGQTITFPNSSYITLRVTPQLA